MAVSDAPHLTLLGRRGDTWSARVPVHLWVKTGVDLLLVLANGEVVWAQVVAWDPATAEAILRPEDPARPPPSDPGTPCAFFDGYWGQRVELVLDRSRHWVEVRYLPGALAPDGTPTEGTWSLEEHATDAPVRQVIEGASDHEHCDICWGKIGFCGADLGFASAGGEWTCTTCHRDFILTRSVEFAITWDGGARDAGRQPLPTDEASSPAPSAVSLPPAPPPPPRGG